MNPPGDVIERITSLGGLSPNGSAPGKAEKQIYETYIPEVGASNWVTCDQAPMSTYLTLDTPEEREYAIAYARWLREQAMHLKADQPEKAAEIEADAAHLERAILLRKTF